MRSKVFLALASVLVVASSQPAFAGIHVEPFVSYGSGKWEWGTQGENYKGFLYGGRLGYSVMVLSFGVEYQGGSLKDEANPPFTIKTTDIGPYVAFEFPVLVRAYAAYYVSSKSNVTRTGVDLDYTGKGYKLGLGFTALPMVSINLEYIANEYDKVDDVKLTDNFTSKTIAVGVSVPFNF